MRQSRVCYLKQQLMKRILIKIRKYSLMKTDDGKGSGELVTLQAKK